jgi:hypothetical protein
MKTTQRAAESLGLYCDPCVHYRSFPYALAQPNQYKARLNPGNYSRSILVTEYVIIVLIFHTALHGANTTFTFLPNLNEYFAIKNS